MYFLKPIQTISLAYKCTVNHHIQKYDNLSKYHLKMYVSPSKSIKNNVRGFRTIKLQTCHRLSM